MSIYTLVVQILDKIMKIAVFISYETVTQTFTKKFRP